LGRSGGTHWKAVFHAQEGSRRTDRLASDCPPPHGLGLAIAMPRSSQLSQRYPQRDRDHTPDENIAPGGRLRPQAISVSENIKIADLR
jgi:hypothetical protein